MDKENCCEQKQRVVQTSNGGVYQNGDQSKWEDVLHKGESVSSSPPFSIPQEDEEEQTGNEEDGRISDHIRGLEEKSTVSGKNDVNDDDHSETLRGCESETFISIHLAEKHPENSHFIRVEGPVSDSNNMLRNPIEGPNMQDIAYENLEILTENGDILPSKSLSDGAENHAQGDNTLAAMFESSGANGDLTNGHIHEKNKNSSLNDGNSDREITTGTSLTLLEINENLSDPSPETYDPLSVHPEINGLKADCIPNSTYLCNSINVSEKPTETRQGALDSTSSSPHTQIYRPLSLSNISSLHAVSVKAEHSSTGEMSTSVTDEHETPASDTGKVVTFAEDKEVFDMAYNQPACITVHLDTPVSCIAPDDVLLEVIQPPVEPPTATQQPTTGILKTDETNPAVLDLSEGFGDARDNTQNTEQQEFINDPLLRTASDTQSQDPVVISDSSQFSLYLHPKSMLLPISDSIVESNEDVEGAKILDEEVECHEIPDQEEDDESGKRREFIVETVAEPEVMLQNEVMVDKFVPGKFDGGSHSTDSNYQDTIGPLDNPQFLKTLNYTASQAFDQDEHFGLHSHGPDTRSLALADLLDPPDLDGGWAWVVLVSSFIAATLLGASVYAAGVLMGAILEQVENNLLKASWVGSVFVCVMSLSGPFVGSVLSRFGARLTVSCAGIVIAVGFVGASLSNTISQLILTHGLIAGLGAGFTVNPLFVTVGQYFNKYRGFACGILAMGAGAGMLGGGAFVSYLLTQFDLHGTYLIWAGVMLHVTPVGLLLWPSPEERIRQLEKELDGGQLKDNNDGGSVSGANSIGNSLFGSINHSMLSGIDRISMGPHGNRVLIPGGFSSRRPSKQRVNGDVEVPLLKAAMHNEMSRSNHSVNKLAAFSKSSLNKSISDIYGPLSPVIGPGQTGYTTGSVPTSGMVQTPKNLTVDGRTPSSNTLNALASPTYLSHAQQQHRTGNTSQYTSMSHLSGRLSQRSGGATAPRGELDNESVTTAFVSGLRPCDAINPRQPLASRSVTTLMGSVASFPTSLAIIKDDLRRFEPSMPYSGTLKGFFITLLDSLRILRNAPFCIFVTTNFFWALGESPVLIHLPSYVVSQGTSMMQASSLYTSMGIASMIGRFLSGLIATDSNIGPVLLYTGSLGVAGLVVTLSPLITATYPQQIVFSFLVGIYTGALVPLTSLITIELLGIGELSLGFGFISMMQGFGYLIGPPLSSVIVNAIGFVNAFVCSGFVLLTGSLLAMSMPLFLANTKDDEEMGLSEHEESHALGDLEKVLQKLEDNSDDNNSDFGRDTGSPVDPTQEDWVFNALDYRRHRSGSGSSVQDEGTSVDKETRWASQLEEVCTTSQQKPSEPETGLGVGERLDTIIEVAGK